MEPHHKRNKVVREAEPPQHSEKRLSRNRVKGFDEVDKQRLRFQSVLFPLGEPNEGGEQPVDRTPVPTKSHLSVKAKLFHHDPHARYKDRLPKKGDLSLCKNWRGICLLDVARCSSAG